MDGRLEKLEERISELEIAQMIARAEVLQAVHMVAQVTASLGLAAFRLQEGDTAGGVEELEIASRLQIRLGEFIDQELGGWRNVHS